MRLSLAALVVGALTYLSPIAHADEVSIAEANKNERGNSLITVEGPRGLFLNPTSGTLEAGELFVSACAANQPVGDQHLVSYGQIVSYGVTDWLEVSALGLELSVDPDQWDGLGGPHIRARIVENDELIPEFSVGGYLYEGTTPLAYQALYAALYQGVTLDGASPLKSIGFHAGLKSLWQDSDFAEANGTVGYFGIEFALPRGIFLVGEVSTKDDIYAHTPFSFGLQVRRPDGFGFSLSAIQAGNQSGIGALVGVGINYM